MSLVRMMIEIGIENMSFIARILPAVEFSSCDDCSQLTEESYVQASRLD